MTAKISASADGLKVYIGNAAEDALEINQTTKTIKPVAPYVIQTGNSPQTWQDVKASRSLGTIFTNNGARPISVAIGATSTAPASAIVLTVGGITIRGATVQTSGFISTVYAEIPVGTTYSVMIDATGTLYEWVELR